MEGERAHLRKNSSELFICLSSSSSMKLSKSILSPGHRLRPNKASPFFPKKRLDNPEPSSPKVTCIGQVRVKSKKKKNRSRRTDISFRKIEAPQGWVHLPVSICDALRTCFSVEGKRREIELVVGGGYEDDGDENEVSVRRRHVLEDIVVEEEAARVSICIPPKNALLLMRCRSDPMKMAALTNRFQFQHGIKEEEFHICEEMVEDKVEMLVQQEEEDSISNMSSSFDEQNAEQLEDCCPIQVESSPDCHLAPSIEEVIEEEAQVNESINEGEEKEQESSITVKESILLDNEDEKDEESSIRLNESIDEDEEKEQESSITLKNDEVLVIPEKEKHLALKEEDKDDDDEELVVTEEKEKAKESIEEQQNEEKPLSLPECLLLMMREPKLSMEVSRETWVCSTDFTTRRPPKPGSDHKRLSFDSKAKQIQPPRSSCSLASMIQHKLANAAAHELTRCKSAPIRVPDSCFWKKLEPRVGV